MISMFEVAEDGGDGFAGHAVGGVDDDFEFFGVLLPRKLQDVFAVGFGEVLLGRICPWPAPVQCVAGPRRCV